MDFYALMTGLLVVVAIVCICWPNEAGKPRARDSAGEPTSNPRQIGILSCIETLKAYVKAGGSLEQAFAEQMSDEPLYSAATMPGRAQLQDMLRARLGPKETIEQADCAAVELDLACRLSKTLGCEASHCLDAVASSYRRNRMMKTLKDNAFTVPKSTVKLLSLLPLATLVLGELMGASPIAFLFGNAAGRVCLLLGAGTYALGMLWMHALMDGIGSGEYQLNGGGELS
ncbi:pilus assembly protein [Bifidobacterium sp. ESL0745]|uniref:pilus assembly protein n=1 Tax=Bifidobacterium sp. ESL0745 TaxID=2983226 RepID=UPI0023F95657|nr:pilus assembly protein [Bifidobacterium sp. ESL0745]MDF7664530.1 pilus assembly protein [Bifidobacterium sp. ESL0745]